MLVQAATGRAAVLAQVALNRLLFLPGSYRGRQAWQNRVAQKSLDFLLCDPATLRPLVAVELDDATHGAERRQQRDADSRAPARGGGTAAGAVCGAEGLRPGRDRPADRAALQCTMTRFAEAEQGRPGRVGTAGPRVPGQEAGTLRYKTLGAPRGNPRGNRMWRFRRAATARRLD